MDRGATRVVSKDAIHTEVYECLSARQHFSDKSRDTSSFCSNMNFSIETINIKNAGAV